MPEKKIRQPAQADRPSLEGFPTDLRNAGKNDVLELARRFSVDFLRLQFTDILGVNKNVEVPRSQFEKALDGEIMFDGSDRKSTRLNSSHSSTSYAVFCLKKKITEEQYHEH